MEEYNNEKYMILENVESLFKRINRLGNEYIIIALALLFHHQHY